jgi:hypothetical protein
MIYRHSFYFEYCTPVAPIAFRAFAMDAQKPDNGARPSHNPRKNLFLSVNYLTLLDRFLNDPA